METTQLKEIYEVMTKNGFDEIELKLGEDNRIKLVREKSAKSVTTGNSVAVRNVASKTESSTDSELAKTSGVKVISEFVGVFQFLDTDEKYWPKAGDSVKKGEKLGKVSNLNSDKLVKSPVSGVISEISVKNDSLVDYGRILFVIENSGSKKA